MKYRIKKTIDGYNFKATYTPQYCIKFLGIYISLRSDFYYNDGIVSCIETFETHEEAEDYIKKHRCQNHNSTSYYYL